MNSVEPEQARRGYSTTTALSFDDLVGPNQERRWKAQAEMLGGLAVEHSSNWLGCSKGSSLGLAPLRIRVA